MTDLSNLTPEQVATMYRIIRELVTKCESFPSSFECYGDEMPEDIQDEAREIVASVEGEAAARFDVFD